MHEPGKAFESTLHKSNVWLKELRTALGCDRAEALAGLRAVLHTLRDRLGPEGVAQLGAQLPMTIRGLYYEGWHPAGKPLLVRRREDFLDLVAERLRLHERLDPERVVEAVLTTLERHVSEGEIVRILATLPRDLRELWPLRLRGEG